MCWSTTPVEHADWSSSPTRTWSTAMDVGDQRDGHVAGNPGAAAQADRLGRRPDRHHHLDRGDGGSTDGGAGYTAAKHAQGARCTERCAASCWESRCGSPRSPPARSRPSFSLVRFDGDQKRAGAVYTGITPLTASDVAEVIGFGRPGPPTSTWTKSSSGPVTKRQRAGSTAWARRRGGRGRGRRRARQARRGRRCDRRGHRNLTCRGMRIGRR